MTAGSASSGSDRERGRFIRWPSPGGRGERKSATGTDHGGKPANAATPVLALLLMLVLGLPAAHAASCTPTPWDEIGPFYRPAAPVRNSIGSGYVLSGTVRSAADCRPVPDARIEVWQAGPTGEYDDGHRATLIPDRQGRYRLETDFPPPYARRPSHIHILVDAKGFEGLITQHYPKKGARSATLDLVLVPEAPDGGKARNPRGR